MTTGSRVSPPPTEGGPPYDLSRVGDQFLLIFSLPGVKPADFRVSLVGDRQVYLEGTVTYRHPVPQEKLLLAERAYGSFARTVDLPLPVDSSRVNVTFQQGVLTIHLPLRLQWVNLNWQE